MGIHVDGLDSSLVFVWHLETGMVFFVLSKFLWFVDNFGGKREERNIEKRQDKTVRERQNCLARAAMISGIRQPWLALTPLLTELLTMLLSQSETHLSHCKKKKEELQDFILKGLLGYSIYSFKC